MKRRRVELRLVATLMVALFASSTSHWPNAVTRSCAASCPIDCPMHTKKLHCHESSGVSCHKTRPQGVALNAPGCTHGASTTDGKVDAALVPPPVILTRELVVCVAMRRPLLPPDVVLDPLFHPPRATVPLAAAA